MKKYLCVFDCKGECESSTPDADGFCTHAEHCQQRSEHCKSHWFIPDTANGAAVEALVAGIYLNTNFGSCKEFVQTLLKSESVVRFNFSRLSVDWFAILRKNKDHDERNVDSFNFAKQFCSKFKCKSPDYKQPRRKGTPELLDVAFRDGAEVAGAMDAFLRRGYGNGYQDFLRQLKIEHPTLQQCYTRMCCEWFLKLAETPELAQGIENKWAMAIETLKPHFRFI